MTPEGLPPSEVAGAPEAPVPQRLALVLPSTGRHDSRAARIAASVAARGHTVTILARSGDGAPVGWSVEDGIAVIRTESSAARPLPLPLRIVDRARAAGRQQRAALAVDPGADLYHGMAFLGLPVALALGAHAHAPVVYDARDLYADARSLSRLVGPARRVMVAWERRQAHRADAVLTVNDALADQLAHRLAVPRPPVVLNCPPRWDASGPRPRRFHERLGLAPADRVLLYHGGLEPERGIEQLLDAVPLLPPEAHVVLMGYGSLRTPLADRLAADPQLAARAHLLDAVPPSELLPWVASADIAVAAIQPTTLNHRLSTPNKLFEALGAGVPLVASDLPGVASVVAGAGAGASQGVPGDGATLGRLCDPTDPRAIASAARELLALDPLAFEALRARCLATAHARFTWEAQLPTLLALYSRLTGRPW